MKILQCALSAMALALASCATVQHSHPEYQKKPLPKKQVKRVQVGDYLNPNPHVLTGWNETIMEAFRRGHALLQYKGKDIGMVMVVPPGKNYPQKSQ